MCIAISHCDFNLYFLMIMNLNIFLHSFIIYGCILTGKLWVHFFYVLFRWTVSLLFLPFSKTLCWSMMDTENLSILNVYNLMCLEISIHPRSDCPSQCYIRDNHHKIFLSVIPLSSERSLYAQHTNSLLYMWYTDVSPFLKLEFFLAGSKGLGFDQILFIRSSFYGPLCFQV